jgi:hypothetical protein
MIPPALRLAAVAAVASVALVSIAVAPVSTQTSSRPSITIAPEITAEPATQIPFPIRVGPEASIPRNSFVKVRGLPPMAALSDGHAIAAGAWAIPLQALPGLTITLPATTAGKVEVVVTLVAVDGSVLDERKFALVISEAAPASAHARPGAPATPAAKALGAQAPPPGEKRGEPAGLPKIAAPAMLPGDRERALKFLKEGDRQMALGNISAARSVYELAAEAGLAQAAMALGGTYDAAELARLNVRGIQPNAKEARSWYERARQLGASEAEQRLQRLGAN